MFSKCLSFALMAVCFALLGFLFDGPCGGARFGQNRLPADDAARDAEAGRFERQLAWPALTKDMRERLVSIRDRSGVYIEIDDSILSGPARRAAVERVLAELDGDSFGKVFDQTTAACELNPRVLSLGVALMQGSDAKLTVNVHEPSVLRRLEKLQRQCSAIMPLVDELRQLASPKEIDLDRDTLLAGGISASELAPWVKSFRSGELPAQIESYEQGCEASVRRIYFERFDSVSRSRDVLTFNIDLRPAAAMRQMAATSAQCVKIVPQLEDFNAKLAREHGLHFTFDIEELASGHIGERSIAAWLDYLKADPSRLDVLKARVLSTAGQHDFDQLRQCLADPSKTASDCNALTIHVVLSTYDGISGWNLRGPLAAMVFPAPISTPLATLDTLFLGKVVNLDIRSRPHIPATFQ